MADFYQREDIDRIRDATLQRIMDEIHLKGYIYDPVMHGYNTNGGNGGAIIYPPPSTPMHCINAANLMRDIAMTEYAEVFKDVTLQIISYPKAFFIPWLNVQRLQPLGGPYPEYVRDVGWVFDKHYRVRYGNMVYDPVFNTHTPNNPVGFSETSFSVCYNPPTISFITQVFGKQYAVTRILLGLRKQTVTEVNDPHQFTVDAQYTVNDASYQ